LLSFIPPRVERLFRPVPLSLKLPTPALAWIARRAVGPCIEGALSMGIAAIGLLRLSAALGAGLRLRPPDQRRSAIFGSIGDSDLFGGKWSSQFAQEIFADR